MNNLQRVKYIHRLLSLDNFRMAREINAMLIDWEEEFNDTNIESMYCTIILKA